MFEHLDDTRPLDAGALRAGVRRRTAQLHRRRRARRLATAAAVPIAAIAGAATLVDRRLGEVQRIELGNRGTTGDPLDDDRPVTVLLLGSDRRTGTDGAGRHDTVLVARVGAGGETALLALPRDLWTGTARINALRTPDLVDWLELRLGIGVDHVVELDADGLGRLAERVRPAVSLDLPVRDASTGLALPAGCQRLDGRQTTAYLRARHLEDLPGDGRSWRADPTGDLGRIARTQALAQVAWGQLGELGPTDLPELVDLLVDHAVLDSRLTATRLLRLAQRLRSSDAPPVVATLPTVEREAPGGQAVLEISPDPAAVETLALVGGNPRRTTPTLPGPADVISAPPAGWALGRVRSC